MAVVDLARTQREAAFVKRVLRQFGLPDDVGSAIAALASTIRDHQQLANLLTGLTPEERTQTYESVRPHLPFKAWPLDRYISSVGERAEREQWATVDEAGQFKPFKTRDTLMDAAQKLVNDAAAVEVLTLVCGECGASEVYHGFGRETKVDVIIKARKAGWVYDHTAKPEREICPKCPTPLRRDA